MCADDHSWAHIVEGASPNCIVLPLALAFFQPVNLPTRNKYAAELGSNQLRILTASYRQ